MKKHHIKPQFLPAQSDNSQSGEGCEPWGARSLPGLVSNLNWILSYIKRKVFLNSSLSCFSFLCPRCQSWHHSVTLALLKPGYFTNLMKNWLWATPKQNPRMHPSTARVLEMHLSLAAWAHFYQYQQYWCDPTHFSMTESCFESLWFNS